MRRVRVVNVTLKPVFQNCDLSLREVWHPDILSVVDSSDFEGTRVILARAHLIPCGVVWHLLERR